MSATTDPTTATPADWPERDRWIDLARRQPRRMARTGLILIALAAVLAVAIFIVEAKVRGDDPDPVVLPVWLALPMMLAGFGLLWLFVARFARRHLIPLAARTHLTLCPRCGDALETATPAGIELYCPRCDQAYKRAEVLSAWWHWAKTGHADKRPRWLLIIRPQPDPAWTALLNRYPWAVPATVLASLALYVAGTFDGPLPVALVRAVPFLTIVAFAFALNIAWSLTRQRVGHEWRCARCGYQRAPAGPNPILCPECGSVWGPKGTLVRGRPRLRVSTALLITAILVAFILSMLTQQFRLSQMLLRLVPTSVLIRAVSTDGADRDTWSELNRRTLSPDQQRELASRLIERCLAAPRRFDLFSENWLTRQIAAGTLDPDLADRLFLRLLTAELTPPTRSPEGAAACLLRVCCRDRWLLRRLLPAYVVLERLAVGDRPLPHPPPGTWQRIPYRPHDCAQIPIDLPALPPGRHTLRATLVLAIGPLPPLPKAGRDHGVLSQRTARGTFALPAGVLWSHRLELTREITIPPPASAPALQP